MALAMDLHMYDRSMSLAPEPKTIERRAISDGMLINNVILS